MTTRNVLAAIVAISLAACSSSQTTKLLTVDLPNGTNTATSVAAAQVALNKAATELCGKSMEVSVESIIVSTDADRNPIGYKATSTIACETPS